MKWNSKCSILQDIERRLSKMERKIIIMTQQSHEPLCTDLASWLLLLLHSMDRRGSRVAADPKEWLDL
jgi:hypothetical protein